MPVKRKGKFVLWKTAKPCDYCPFAKDAHGRQMRESLGRARLAEIHGSLRKGRAFYCHKSTREAGWSEDMASYAPVSPELVCAGSIAWAEAHGAPEADLVQVMRRLEIMAARGILK